MRQPRRPEDLRYTRTMDRRATLDRGRDAWIDLPSAGGTDCFLTPERTDLTPGASITCASSRCSGKSLVWRHDARRKITSAPGEHEQADNKTTR